MQGLIGAEDANHGRRQKMQPLVKEGGIKTKRTWATEKNQRAKQAIKSVSTLTRNLAA